MNVVERNLEDVIGDKCFVDYRDTYNLKRRWMNFGYMWRWIILEQVLEDFKSD